MGLSFEIVQVVPSKRMQMMAEPYLQDGAD